MVSPMPMVDRYAVMGNPIAHSQSPAIHAAFAAQTGQAIDYSKLLTPLNGFAQTVRSAIAGGVKGVNVTVPFKFEAYQIAHSVSKRAQLAQAANTLIFNEQGHIYADNTDGAGLVWDLTSSLGSLKGKRVLILGAGGAVAGVLPSLLDAGVTHISVLNRTEAKAIQIIEQLKGFGSAVTLYAGGLNSEPKSVDVIINGTSSSLSGASIDIHAAWFDGVQLAYDMMYGAQPTVFLHRAQSHGVAIKDGLGMLVGQAAEAFYGWRHVMPDATEVLTERRRLLQQASTP